MNLYSVRHDEGRIHHTFSKQTSTVSVLALMHDERAFLSGSWDASILVSAFCCRATIGLIDHLLIALGLEQWAIE